MKLFFCFILFFINISSSVADTGADRCRTEDCMCKVSEGVALDYTTGTRPSKRAHSVYFLENSHSISAAQERKIIDFLNKFYEYNVEISVIGYADGCGSHDYNMVLSNKRAETISVVLSNSFQNIKVSTSYLGEKSSVHLLESKRVDIVVHTKNKFTTKIEKHPADVYLIDASGSMWDGWHDWSDLVNASLKPNSRIYVSMMRGCYNGQSISSIRPQSGTEIWYSYWKVLDHMKRGETLLIISDLDSNVPLSVREASVIDKKVKDRGVSVSIIR